MEKRYQVFVSSTYEDLRKERDMVSNAILELGHIPAGMELFGSDSDGTWTVIEKTILLSDYMVLILGGRYGSISNRTGLSFTEMEFDFAKEHGIPILAFRHKDKGQLHSANVDQGERAEKLDRFYEKVKDAGTVPSWMNGDDLTRNVMSSLSKSFVNKPRPGWVRGDVGSGPVHQPAGPVLEIEFSDPISERGLGWEIDQHWATVCRMPDHVPDYTGSEKVSGGYRFSSDSISPNRSYLRELSEWLRIWGQCRPVRLSVVNGGSVPAKDVCVEITVSADGGLEVKSRDQMPVIPSSSLIGMIGPKATIDNNSQRSGRLTVRRVGAAFKITLHCGDLQPGRRVLSDTFFLGTTQAIRITLNSEMFAANLAEPVRGTLTINNGIMEIGPTLRDLKNLPIEMGMAAGLNASQILDVCLKFVEEHSRV